MSRDPATDNVIVSYLTLRGVIGALGIALPFLVAIWGCVLLGDVRLLPSISDYYSLRTRDVFVGVLVTVAWFLFTYRGYERKDDIAGNVACLFALGVAFFPNSGGSLERVIHYVSAAGFFVTLAGISYFLFTKSGGSPTPEKLLRNRVYRACAVVMVVCVLLIPLSQLAAGDTALARLSPVFWLETAALLAFGFSWFVKGEVILGDAVATPPSTSDLAASS